MTLRDIPLIRWDRIGSVNLAPVDIVDHEGYRKYLFMDQVWDEVLKVAKKLRSGKSNETRIKNLMKQLSNERNKFLKSKEEEI